MKERFINFGDTMCTELLPPVPSSLNIELNSTCNHRCVFCPYHGEKASRGIGNHVMDYEFAVKILDEAAELGIGRKEVGFYVCGEPFLYKKLPDIIRYAKNKGFSYTFLTSNGALATPERLKEVVDAGLDSIRFSVNAPTRELYQQIHGRDDYDKVCKHIQFLSKYREENKKKISISLSCVLSKKTLGMESLIKKQFEKYVDDILFFPVIISNEQKPFLSEYALEDETPRSLKTGFVCKPVFDSMYIDAIGRVLSCCEAYGREEGVVYDLNKKLDLLAAWQSEGFQNYRKRFLNHKKLKGTICEYCYLATLNDESFREMNGL